MALTGSLWVGGPGAFLGFRVQAKRLDHRSERYESLFSSRRKLTVQIDKLIRAAITAPRPLFPLLAFYNYPVPTDGEGRGITCPRLRATPHLAGWTVASAREVRNRVLARQSKKCGDYIDLMLPISCLFCCPADCARNPGARPEGLADAVRERLENVWPGAAPRPSVHQVGPVYIERLYKGEDVLGGWGSMPRALRSSFLGERKIPRDVSRVILVRDRPRR